MRPDVERRHQEEDEWPRRQLNAGLMAAGAVPCAPAILRAQGDPAAKLWLPCRTFGRCAAQSTSTGVERT
jgi:hypothetical protein